MLLDVILLAQHRLGNLDDGWELITGSRLLTSCSGMASGVLDPVITNGAGAYLVTGSIGCNPPRPRLTGSSLSLVDQR
jgi:hypothetical protein